MLLDLRIHALNKLREPSACYPGHPILKQAHRVSTARPGEQQQHRNETNNERREGSPSYVGVNGGQREDVGRQMASSSLGMAKPTDGTTFVEAVLLRKEKPA